MKIYNCIPVNGQLDIYAAPFVTIRTSWCGNVLFVVQVAYAEYSVYHKVYHLT